MSLVNRETDYALRILRSLSDGQTKSVSAICDEQEFAKSFAHKITKKLEQAGFVQISRGPGGGVSVACNLSEKTMYDLLDAVDNHQYVNDCFKEGYDCEFSECDGCKIHQAFQEWQTQLDKHLKEMKIEALF